MTPDLDKLRALVAYADQAADDDEIPWAEPFRDMLSRMDRGRQRELTLRQREWICEVHEKVLGDPVYLNLVSTGQVPRGREVPTPEVLLNLPKRPPGRTA